MAYLQLIPCSANPYLHHRGSQNSKTNMTANQGVKDCPEHSLSTEVPIKIPSPASCTYPQCHKARLCARRNLSQKEKQNRSEMYPVPPEQGEAVVHDSHIMGVEVWGFCEAAVQCT